MFSMRVCFLFVTPLVMPVTMFPLFDHATLTVTLTENRKVNLAVELEGLGVDVIQTEGKFSLDPSK